MSNFSISPATPQIKQQKSTDKARGEIPMDIASWRPIREQYIRRAAQLVHFLLAPLLLPERTLRRHHSIDEVQPAYSEPTHRRIRGKEMGELHSR